MVGEGGAPNASARSGSLSDQVGRVADTIAACERLALLSARTLLQCTAKGDEGFTFIASVSRDLSNLSTEMHPTTTAQCAAALQALVPVVGRFQLGTREGRDLPFHPIERNAMEAFKPDKVLDDLRRAVSDSVDVLAAKNAATPEEALRATFGSTTFGYLHPFTAALVLRSLAPSDAVWKPAWWGALFSVIWFLNRRGGAPHAYPNIQATNSAGTAFLTAKCVEAIETVLQVFGRRRDRFKRIIELMKQLGALKRIGAAVPYDMLKSERDYRERILMRELRSRVHELQLDSSFPHIYANWHALLSKSDSGDCATVISTLSQALNGIEDQHEQIRIEAAKSLTGLKEIDECVGRIHDIIRFRLLSEDERAKVPRPNVIEAAEFQCCRDNQLPHWICSEDIWLSTKKAVGQLDDAGAGDPERETLAMLEAHWHRHRDASGSAIGTLRAFDFYLRAILTEFEQGATPAPGTDEAKLAAFVDGFSRATAHISVLREHLLKDKESGVRWAEVLMNRQLVAATSRAMTQFDPSELAHALRVACYGERKIDLDLILTALHVLCDAQRADGSWSYQQPFHWTSTGLSAPTLSIDTASAMVATVRALLENPERHGTNVEECSAKLHSVYDTIDRAFRWLSIGLQSFRVPPALRSSADPQSLRTDTLYGWCSDRAHEQGRIHSWVTATALEFLVNLRRLQQGRINAVLRAAFLSYHPDELHVLGDVAPTDLKAMAHPTGPTILQLDELLRPHKEVETYEDPWFPKVPPKASISCWSAIFHGPPGTSKTFLAQAIAGELRWPLISLSPSDFLSEGGEYIESRAQDIFNALSCGSRIVYFFDEIDELIRDRGKNGDAQRSTYSFVTPSFLTKFQDLHKAAKSNEFIFILGTNYYDRIDSAAKRSGRIDKDFLIIYPDADARAQMLFNFVMKKSGYKPGRDLHDEHLAKAGAVFTRLDTAWKHALDERAKDLTDSDKAFVEKGKKEHFIETVAAFTGLLSYQRISDLVDEHAEFFSPPEADALPEIDDKSFSKLLTVIEAIACGEEQRFRPEIVIADYKDPERKALLDLCSSEVFPWWTKKRAGKSARAVYEN